MSYIYGSVPFFECLVRAEYTRDRKDRHGEYYPAVAHAVRCVRGHTLWFQVIFTQQHAGAAFMLPLEALVTKPCPPVPTATVQPWDVFSSDFGVSQDTFTARGAVSVLPDRAPGQYRFTIDFAGTDLAEHPDQHKALHVVFRDDGLIGAYPNNRLLWHDPAFWTTSTERPDFVSLSGEFRAEGTVPVQPKTLSTSAEGSMCQRCKERDAEFDRIAGSIKTCCRICMACYDELVYRLGADGKEWVRRTRTATVSAEDCRIPIKPRQPDHPGNAPGTHRLQSRWIAKGQTLVCRLCGDVLRNPDVETAAQAHAARCDGPAMWVLCDHLGCATGKLVNHHGPGGSRFCVDHEPGSHA